MKSSGAIPKSSGARSKVKYPSDSHKSKKGSLYEEDGNFKNIGAGNSNTNENHSSLAICNEVEVFSPLEAKEIVLTVDGIRMKRPALDQYWIVKKSYLHFQSPPGASSENSIVGAMEAWVEQTDFIIEDLSWLLSLPHHRFWSQMIFDSSIHECLESYLTNVPRWFNNENSDPGCHVIIEKIHHLIFRIYLRMATHKESKEDFISPSVFGKVIYDNFLFDVCSMLDLCSLYSSSNEALLSKMLSNIFSNQPKYLEDLAEMAKSLKELIESLQARMVIMGNAPISNGPLSRQEFIINNDHLIDTITYLLDIFSSIHSLFRIFPRSIEVFHSCDYQLSLCSFYEHVIPILEENIPSATDLEDEEWFSRIRTHLRHIRMDALSIYRLMIQHFCFDGIGDPGGAGKCTEEFIHFMSACIEDKIFTVDYVSAYDLDTDLNRLRNAGADPTSLNFIKEAVQLVIEETRPNFPDNGDGCLNGSIEDQLVMTCSDNSGMNGYYVGETSAISDLEITSLVSQIQDLLPDLGSGFIASCLKFYNYSSEDTLNALLAGPLPPCLDSLDRSDCEILKPNAQIASFVEDKEVEKDVEHSEDDTLVSARGNVYNDDEFDVFSKNVKPNINNMHKGKRKEDVKAIDNELVDKVKALAVEYDSSRGYSIYDDEDKYTPIAELEYNDEYDDTYDNDYTGDMDVGDKKKIPVQTLRGKGSFNAPMVEFESEESEEESEGANYSQPNGVRGSTFRPFCSNPEDLRRKAEERRKAKMSNKFKNKDWNVPGLQAQPVGDIGPKPQAQAPSKNSGKQWRSNPDDDDRPKHVGKSDKPSSQHGKAQDKTYKQKMVNKGNFRRNAAQAKQRSFM